eukprot:m.157763 g.157763  ORF g.157763 m.157763 type:complete len:472 (-) comp52972_c0_seq1:186-1601(-)
MTDWVAIAKENAHKPGQKFTPADAIFADASGHVLDAVTPKLLIGAILCDRFEIQRYIESGAFGRGWVAADQADGGKNVFLKTFRSLNDRAAPCDAASHEKMIQKEVEVLLQAEAHHIPPHLNVVSATRVYFGPIVVPLSGRKGEMFFCVTPDLCEGGELYNYLVFGNGIKKFTEKIARFYFKQMVDGVQHMHKHGMFHRDLKLENMVLDSHYNLKIMDFGHAKHASECVSTVDATSGEVKFVASTFVGTSSYQPPELNEKGASYDPAAFDVWSLGIVLFFLVGIEGLAAKQKDFTFMQRLRNKATDVYLDQKRSDGEVPDNARFWEYFGSTLKFTPELKHLINGILDGNWKKRMTIERILAHPWLQGEMPSHDEVVAAMSGRSAGIVGRNATVDLSGQASSQANAVELVEKAIRVVAPYKRQDHKFAILSPPKFAVVVEAPEKVLLIWLSGGLAEWLEFRKLFSTQLGLDQ